MPASSSPLTVLLATTPSLLLATVLVVATALLLHHASGFIKGQLDRIVIHQHYAPEQLGIYAAGLQLASILSILLLAASFPLLLAATGMLLASLLGTTITLLRRGLDRCFGGVFAPRGQRGRRQPYPRNYGG